MDKKTDVSRQLANAPVWSLIIKLSIPAIFAQIVNLLYNIVDRIYIGHMEDVGTMAITGVGLCFPVLSLISAFTMLVAQGVHLVLLLKWEKVTIKRQKKFLGTALYCLWCYR